MARKPNPNNPWVGSHAAPQFGAIPYAWPMASQTQTVLQALAATGLVSTTTAHGSPTFHTALYVGRGIPDVWVAPGQHISIDNLTSAYNARSAERATYGVDISVSQDRGDRIVEVNLPGDLPSQDVRVQLPSFASAGVKQVSGGTYDAATHTVTISPGHSTVHVRLGKANRPTVHVDIASTVAGAHTQPSLQAGVPTTATATVDNVGKSQIRDVSVTLHKPAGWTVTATSPTTIPMIDAGKTGTVTWSLTPPADGNGNIGLPLTVGYTADYGASGSVGAEPFVTVQRPLPLPAGSTDLALGATPSASYTSPWESVSAINDGIYPPSSNDNQNPRWGDWPQEGSQWIELDWNQAITTNGSALYFLDDGGGVRLPASWKVQYWNGSAFVDVANPSGYTSALNSFNQVGFDPVTTTKLRVALQSTPTASVGVLEWIADSAP